MSTRALARLSASSVEAPAGLATRAHPDPIDQGLGLGLGGDPGPFVADRLRVVATNAFRRLQHKTQVFLTDEGDHFRTRLTHTLEVSLLARRLCGALGLDADLAEAIALAHDLGHPPFGHAGERALDAFARSKGLPGFEHNLQSLRVVEFLEHPYPPFRGLNLTQAVRDALSGHSTPFDQPSRLSPVPWVRDPAASAPPTSAPRQICLEGQLVNLADQIAYLVHDLEDAWLRGLIKTVPVWPPLMSWQEALPAEWANSVDANVRVRRPVCEAWQEQLMADVVRETLARSAGLATPQEVLTHPEPVAAFGRQMRLAVDQWREFMLKRVYRHPLVARRERRLCAMLTHLAEAIHDDPTLLPPRFQDRLASLGRPVVVIDYLAGMTDRYCEQRFREL